MTTSLIKEEFVRLAQQYQQLNHSVCVWGNKGSITMWQQLYQSTTTVTYPEQKSFVEQELLINQPNMLFITSNDPYILVMQKKLCKKLALYLLQLPLELIKF